MTKQRFFEPRDLVSARLATSVVAGPGGRVAFTLRQLEGDDNIYRAQVWVASPGEEPVQMTRGDKSSLAPRWAPDGKHLAFITTRDDGKCGDDGPQGQVWFLPMSGGEAFCVTRASEGVHNYEWAPDGSALFYVADEPDLTFTRSRKSRAKKRKDDAIVERGERFRKQIWRMEPKSGAEPTLVFDGCFGLSDIAVSPDGSQIAYTTNYSGWWEDSDKLDLWVLDVATGERKQLTRGIGYIWNPTYSPDGSTLAFWSVREQKYSYSQFDLFTVPVSGGDPVNLSQTLAPSYTGDIQAMVWESNENLLIQSGEGVYTNVSRLNRQTGAMERITPQEHIVFAFSIAQDRTWIAYLSESAHRLPEVVTQRLDGGRPEVLSNLNPAFRTEFRWGEQQVISWRSGDGLDVEGLLILPPDHEPGQKHPLLVYIHGGPHSRVQHTLRGYMCAQALAAKGYAVLSPNYRGSAGYGHAFAIANYRDLGGGDFQDIMSGVDYAISQGWADESRMGILGGSYGGYMTNWAIGQTDRFKAAVSMFGIFNLVTDYGQSDLPTWEPGYLGAYWWQDEEIYAKCSPATHVERMNTPVLLLHGDSDNNTRPANSREMYQALRHRGKTVQFVRYPREGHGMVEPGHKLDEYRRIFAWFGQHILGESALPEGEVVKDGHRLTVKAATVVADYHGRKPKGRFVALPISLTPAEGAVKFELGQVHLLQETGGMTWEFGVTGVDVGGILVPASGWIETHEPADLTLVLDLPAKAPGGLYRLELDGFPALGIRLPDPQ